MPCDSYINIDCDLGKSDAGLMHAALTALEVGAIRTQGTRLYFGRGEYIDTATGQSQLAPGREVNQVRRAYAAEVVKATAKQCGWTVKQNPQDKFKYQIIKR